MKKLLLVFILFTAAAFSTGTASSPCVEKQEQHFSDPIVAYFVSGGVQYFLHGTYPANNIITEVSWSGGSTGMGNFGFFYIYHNPQVLAAEVSFTGPNGPVLWNDIVTLEL